MAAYGPKLGLDFESAVKIGSVFGGGMGKTGGTCGVVTGALMALGLKYGAIDAKDKETKAIGYELARKFIREFTSRNRATDCRELLGFDIYTRERLTADEGRVIFDNCRKYVQDAADILKEMMKR